MTRAEVDALCKAAKALADAADKVGALYDSLPQEVEAMARALQDVRDALKKRQPVKKATARGGSGWGGSGNPVKDGG